MRSDNPMRTDREERVATVGAHRVAYAYDPDAEAWYVTASSVPGLAADAPSEEELLAVLPGLVGLTTLP